MNIKQNINQFPQLSDNSTSLQTNSTIGKLNTNTLPLDDVENKNNLFGPFVINILGMVFKFYIIGTDVYYFRNNKWIKL
jgi:hypothetical protein